MDIDSSLRFLVMKTLSKILIKSDSKKDLDLDKIDATCDIVWNEVKYDFFNIIDKYPEEKNSSIYQLFLIDRKNKLRKKYPDLSEKDFNILFDKCLPNIEKRWIKNKSKYKENLKII